ncbi:MAG: complex I subunit 5 family protein [Acidilobaceae archaeon]
MSLTTLIIEHSLMITAVAIATEFVIAKVSSRLAGAVAFVHSLILSLAFGALALDSIKSETLLKLELNMGFFNLPLVVTPLSAPIILLTCLIAPFISLYSINYLYSYRLPVDRFYTVYSATLLSVLIYFSAGDLIVLLIFMEVASVLTGLLIAYKLKDLEISSALKYIFVFVAVDKLAVAGAGIIWTLTGSIDIPGSLIQLGLTQDVLLASLASLLLLIAFVTKATLAPLSFWLIWAMDAPSNVSALFHFGIIILMGVYGLVLFTFSATASEQLALVIGLSALIGGSLGAILASATMLATRDVKHLVGLSTIENAGLTAVCIGGSFLLFHTSPGLSSLFLSTAYLHSLAHAYSKATMFMNTGILVLTAHSRDLKDLSGLSSKMPTTGAVFMIASATFLGVPPSLMFASVLLILTSTLLGSFENKVLIVGFISTILAHLLSSLAYLRFAKIVLFEDLEVKDLEVKEDTLMLFPQVGLLTLSFLSLALLPRLSKFFECPATYLGLPKALPDVTLQALSVVAPLTLVPLLAVSIAMVLRKR